MAIPEHVLDRIRERVSIADVVGQHVNLRRAGRSLKGLCPFHAEKTPSFNVNEERGTYKCFGCGKGGNAFTFLMEMEGKTFPEAVEALAARAGVEIPREEESPREKSERAERSRILEVLSLAARYYRHQFTDGRAGETAREYAAQRGIGPEAAEIFSIGAAPKGWDNLLRFLEKKGIDVNLGLKAGVLAKNDAGRYYDRFRDRLIFPIADATGRVVSFGGRIMGQGEPKYLNGPETEVFLKGRVLYGLFQGAKALRELNRAILVEGYMDVVILHQKGYPGCLATLGTALTREHVEAIRRRADEAVLVYDGDDAGQKAAERSLEIFLSEGFPPRAVVLPKEEDPDSFVSKGFDLNAEIARAPKLFEVVLDRILKRHNVRSPDGRIRATEEMAEHLRLVHNVRPSDANEYIKEAAEKIRISEEDFRARLQLVFSRGRERPVEHALPSAPVIGELSRELLKALLHWPDHREDFTDASGEKWFEDEEVARIAAFIAARPEPVSIFPVEKVPPEYRSLVVELINEEAIADDYPALTVQLEKKRLKKLSETLERRIRESEARGDWEELGRLGLEKTRIDREISGK